MVPTNYTKIWELNLDVAITKHNPKLQLINVIQEKAQLIFVRILLLIKFSFQ